MTRKISAAMFAMSLCLIGVPNASSITSFETTVAEIVANPNKFSQNQVRVQGNAVQIQRKLDESGSPWVSFFLVDPSTGDKVVVEYGATLLGKLDLQESDLVTVDGDFYQRPAQTGFTNVIRAMAVLK
jgi:hypothetical protein